MTARINSLLLPIAWLAIAAGACSSSKRVPEGNAIPSTTVNSTHGATPKYTVEVVNSKGVQVLNLTFTAAVPTADVADKALRDELEKLIKKNPSTDALAYAYQGDEELSENQYSGALVYKASNKKIMTMDEYHGVKSTSTSRSAYHLHSEELQTLPGITPKKTWLSLSLVYANAPPPEVGYDAMIAEIEKVRARGLDVNAYVKTGDRKIKTSWNQVRDSDGAFVFADYDASTNQVTRKGKVLKQF